MKKKRELALHLVTQFFRHPLLKDSTVDDYLRVEKARIDMVRYFLAKEKADESINNLKIDIECEAPVLHAQLTYLDNETLMGFANAIANNIWMFLVSENGDFYTSIILSSVSLIYSSASFIPVMASIWVCISVLAFLISV